jgi:hypothetical protein
MSLPLNITADATAPKTFDLGMFLPDGHLRGSEVLGERLKGFTAGITQGLDVEGEKAGCLTSKIRTCEHLLADIGSTGIAIALSCQCCLGWFSPCFPVRLMLISPSQLSRRSLRKGRRECLLGASSC